MAFAHELDRPLGALAAMRYSLDLTPELREEAYQQVKAEITRLRVELEVATADFPPDSQTLKDESRKLLKLRIKNGARKIRKAHLRLQELADQRDRARAERSALRLELQLVIQDQADLLAAVEEAERDGEKVEPGTIRQIMDWPL